jgi:hypothetical protein
VPIRAAHSDILFRFWYLPHHPLGLRMVTARNPRVLTALSKNSLHSCS